MEDSRMQTLRKILILVLIVMTGFLGIPAILGGIALMGNLYAPPVEMLQGSPFTSFLLPGLVLSVIVGGSALAAMILLIRRNPFGELVALTSGVIIMFFEFIEVMVIGMQAGVSQFMQVFYFMFGTLICVVAVGILGIDRLPQKSNE
jgi:hypothetical protein